MYAGPTAPSGWLECDGTSYSTSTYPDLYAVIGETFGGGGGNFNVPDMRDRFPVGTGTTYSIGDTGGAASVTLTEAQLAQHSHAATGLSTGGGSAHNHSISGSSGTQSANHSHTITVDSGGASHNHSLTTNYEYFWLRDIGGTAGAQNVDTSAGSFDTYYGTIANTTATHGHSASSGDNNGNHTHSLSSGTIGDESAHTHTVSGSTADTGSDSAHENRPPYMGLMFIIKT
jgi:microcystin-dependent protein